MDSVLEIYPKKFEIERFIGQLHRKTNDIVNNESGELWQKHNAYSTYCVILLMYLTCHRPARDPFWSCKHMDLKDGLILINDKVVDKKREYRLVSLPGLAVEQMLEYRQYLYSLSTLLKDHGEAGRVLSAAVYSIESPGKQKIPQFFLMDESLGTTKSITGKVIKEYTRDIGWFPPNFGRVVFATELLKELGVAKSIEIQLGHMDSELHPFGAVSEIVPKNILGDMAEKTDSIMKRLGWKTIPSFIKRKGGAVYDINCDWFKKLKIHESNKFGDEYRKAVRKTVSNKYSDLIRNIIKEEGFKFKNGLMQCEVDNVVDRICRRAEEMSMSERRCLYIFYKFMDVADNKYKLKFKIKRRFPILQGRSPYTTESLAHYGEVKRLRKAFIARCEKKSFGSYVPSVEERMAELILSAAIYGYVGDGGRLMNICDAIKTGCYCFNKEIFMDLKLYPKYEKEHEKNVFRWFPDKVSMTLISGLFEITGNNMPEVRKKEVVKELKKLLRELSFNYSSRNVCCQLATLVTSAMSVEVPGYLRDIASGYKKSASIPLPSYVRIVSGKGLALKHKPSNLRKTEVSTCWFPVSRYAKVGVKKEIHYFIKAIRNAFNLAHDVDHNMHKNINGRKKLLLIKKVNEAMGDGSLWCETANALASWLIEMCVSGTSRSDDAAISTIENYFFLVAKPVMAEGFDKAILSLDGAGYEELFDNCMAYNKQKDKGTLPRELRQFHGFMVDRWAVDYVDWSEIYSRSGMESVTFIPNANIVTEHEYLEIIDYILNDNLDEVRKRQYIVLMVLGYRFGLRFGEALRVQWKNIQYDEDLQEIHVRVKKGFHGNPKTKAGIRRVTLITKLTRKENDALKYLLNIYEQGFVSDSQQGLMSDIGANRHLIDRAEASAYLVNIIRFISGDESLRFHHLRHSWANEACLRSYSFEAGNNIEYEFVTQYADKDVISLRDAAVLIGHADEGTLLGSYMHKADRIIHEYCNRVAPKIGARCLQYMASIKYDAARQRLNRKGVNADDYIQMLKLHKKVQRPEIKLKDKSNTITACAEVSAEPSLTMINEIVLVSGGEFSGRHQYDRVDSIAQRFCLTAEKVNEILTAAASVERKSGYELFSLGQFDRDPMDVCEYEQRWCWPKNITGDGRVRALLYKVSKHFDKLPAQDMKVIHEGISLWCEGYCSADKGVYVTEAKDIATYSSAVDLIGFKGLRAEITVPLEFPKKYEYIKKKFGENCKVGVSKIRNAPKKTKLERESRVKISVITKDTDIVTKQTFNRVMFCLATWQGLQ